MMLDFNGLMFWRSQDLGTVVSPLVTVDLLDQSSGDMNEGFFRKSNLEIYV